MVRQRRLQHAVPAERHREAARRPVQRQRDFADPPALRHRRRRPPRRAPLLRRGEQFELDAVLRDAEPLQRARRRQHHRLRPAQKRRMQRSGVDEAAEQLAAFLGIEPSGEQVDLLRIGLQHMQDRQPPEVEVFQILKRLAEHDRGNLPVGVDQQKARFRLARQRRLQHRKHRRDPAPAGDEQIGARRSGIERRMKHAHRRHRLQNVADLQLFVEEAGKHARLPDPDLQPPLVHARADRIAAPQFLAVELAPQGQILPLCKSEGGAVLIARG